MIHINQCNWATVTHPEARTELLNACRLVASCNWLSEAGERLVQMLEPAWYVDLGVDCIRVFAKDGDGWPLKEATITLV